MRILKILLIMILCFSIILSSFVFCFATVNEHLKFLGLDYDTRYTPAGEVNIYSDSIDFNNTTNSSTFIQYRIPPGNYTFSGTADFYDLTQIFNIFNTVINFYDLYNCSQVRTSNFTCINLSSKKTDFSFSFTIDNPTNINFVCQGLSSISFNLATPSAPIGWQTNNIEVKAGYVLVVDRFYNGSIISDLPDHIQINSIVSVPKPVFKSWKNGASFGYINTLSDLSASEDLASDNLIWARPSNGGNFAGTQADFNTSSSRYWYFANPLYYISGNKQYVNNSAIVKFENVTSSAPDGFLGNYYLIPLTASTSPDSSTGFNNTVDTSKETHIWYGIEDSDGNINNQGWYSYSDLESLLSQSSVNTNSIGNLSEVPVGGNNAGDIYSSVSDTQSSAELTLFQKIESILSSGINSVDRLFQSAQGFFSFMSNLFSWMPTELLTIISSVFIIFLVVACIKLFL